MSALTNVAFSDGFFEAQNKLPSNIQSKVNQTILKLMANSEQSGLNVEKLKVCKDDSFHSARVDQAYRIIFSAQGNVMLLLWVDHHDDAYKWALTHKCTINAESGAIQLYKTELTEEQLPADVSIDPNTYLPPLFESLKDKQLMKLGVPKEHIEVVRGIKTEEELDRLQGYLPDEAYEGLYFFNAGESYEAILAERAVNEEDQFNTSDFIAALERLQTKAKFSVVEGEHELEEILSASLEKWRVFLHPSQRRLVEGNKNGPVRVLGGAGTGKTVVAMHRAKWLAERVESDQKVLFTTFTKNLAQDIQDQLNTLCGEKLMAKIEVVNLDQWVRYFLRKQKYDFEILYDSKVFKRLWEQAYSDKPTDLYFTLEFFKEEWEQVIQPQAVTTVDEYKKAKRIGRGTRLNRSQRLGIWKVFESYRNLLNQNSYKEVSDAYRDAADFIANKSNHVPLNYSSIIIDEAQDMGSQAFKLLRAIVPEDKNDLFIVGDAHQRIYGQNKVVLGQVGINIRGRSAKLKINYRTTDEIRSWATNLLEGCDIDDLDGGSDSNQFYKSLTHGNPPAHVAANSFDEQVELIKRILDEQQSSLSNVCIVARTNSEVEKIEKSLASKGVKTHIIKTSETNAPDDAVRLATVHRVKGLEFDHVIFASFNDGLVPLQFIADQSADEVSREALDLQERSLVYVALTRAKRLVHIISYGVASRYLA
jgi:mRNA-degrading endonuclease RelE of RelBE toxin-antitoxin system